MLGAQRPAGAQGDRREVEEEEGPAAYTLPSAARSEGKQGSRGSARHVAWLHTDFQKGLGCLSQEAGLFLESKAGWGSTVNDGLVAGSQRRDPSSSPGPALPSLSCLICSTGIFVGALSPPTPRLKKLGYLTSRSPRCMPRRRLQTPHSRGQ